MIDRIVQRVLPLLPFETALRLCTGNLDWFTLLGLHSTDVPPPPEDPVTVMGLRFPNPVGMAAGFDADGQCVSALGALGFGFVEVGTVTAEPQQPAGEPARLDRRERSITRGPCRPSAGIARVNANLRSAEAFRLRGGVTGISIGLGHPLVQASPAEKALALAGLFDNHWNQTCFCIHLFFPFKS